MSEEKTVDTAELIKSLKDLGISDEEIQKSLNTTQEEIIVETEKKEKIEKSIEDQISEKQVELDKLMEIKKSNTPVDFESKFNDIEKSLTNKLEESTNTFTSKFDGLVDLVKSLTSKVVELNENNEKLIEDNDSLKKSLGDSAQILEKLANFTPGLKSVKSQNFIDRFQKSESGDGKEVLSASVNKEEISSRLAKKMDNTEFIKSFGNDIANFEVSGKVSPTLEKAIKDELGIELVP